MTGVINAFLLTYAALFPIMNPIGSASIFLALTQHLPPEVRRDLVLRIAINSFGLLVGVIFLGSYVLQFFGITLPVVRIAGGLVVVAFTWKMLNDENHVTEKTAKETGDRDEAHPGLDAFYPLTMPITIGPGSIAVAVALGSERPKDLSDWQTLLQLASGAVAGALALAATIYVCYRFADRVVVALGPAAMNVMTRLMAFILLCVGIQILWTGISALIR
jgi:multiple antibiotic resistance protein